MPCVSCVESLARRLVENHRLNWIFALERATKGMERYYKHHETMLAKLHHVPNVHTPSQGEVEAHIERFGVNPDYTQGCEGNAGFCTCRSNPKIPSAPCLQLIGCAGVCDCPDPLPNSHQVSSACFKTCLCSNYSPPCPDAVGCSCTGDCGYDCDEGFEWDGEACVLLAAKQLRRLLVGVGL